MKILAFDSTARVASVSVADGDRILAVYNIDNGLTQSELLLPMAEAMLKSLRLDFSDIDAFAVTAGPGSFTGVRIGVSLVKGLAFGRKAPCLSVSTLEALAENLRGISAVIVPCMDARRGQVYTAVFECDGENITRKTADSALPLTELFEILKEYNDQKIYLVGDGYDIAYRTLSDMGLTSLQNTPPLLRNQNAASVAAVAKRMLDLEKTLTDDTLSPTYLRIPQAERERLERMKGQKQ